MSCMNKLLRVEFSTQDVCGVCMGMLWRLQGCRRRESGENQSIRKGKGLSVLCVLSPQPSTLRDTVQHVIGMITPNTHPCPHHIPPHSPANCPFDPDLPHLLLATPSFLLSLLSLSRCVFLYSCHISWIRFQPPATSPDRPQCKQRFELM